MALDADFTENADLIETLPSHQATNYLHLYTAISSIIQKILEEIYDIPNPELCGAPVNENRAMLRIKVPENGPLKEQFNRSLNDFLNDLTMTRLESDDIFITRDSEGFNVLSFKAEEMLPLLMRFTTNYPDQHEYHMPFMQAFALYERVENRQPAQHLN